MNLKSSLLPLLAILCLAGELSAQANHWSPVAPTAIPAETFERYYRPVQFRPYQLNEAAMRTQLAAAPQEGSTAASASPVVIAVPDAQGAILHFRVVETALMEKPLADRFSSIRTYQGTGLERPGAVIRIDVSPLGFHAVITGAGEKTIYINALAPATQLYVVFDRDGLAEIPGSFECKTGSMFDKTAVDVSAVGADDGLRRSFRLAVTVTGEFSQACLNGSETSDLERKTKVMAVLTTNLNRANAVFERDFGVRLSFVAAMESLLFLSPTTDPFPVDDVTWNAVTQSTIDNNIGAAGYDIGHLLAKVPVNGENGNAGCIACVCKADKGSGYTAHSVVQGDPLVIDVWTHEMGHQFGANHTHTFFMNEGTGAQMEPGSGSTIMGYAGITGATDVQAHADDYFHAKSIEQVTAYLKSPTGATCAVNTPTGNNIPVVNAGTDYTIPRSTPFTLTGQATDMDGNILTYCWEQYDAFAWGSGSSTFPLITSASGPVFRSTMYSSFGSRTFPAIATILGGGTANTWEALPSVGRTMNFRLTVRDNAVTGPANNADDMQLRVDGDSGPFAITAPNTAVTWTAGEFRTITWDVAGSNTGLVNCANVAIELSTDGGVMFPHTLAASTPNDGSHEIIVPSQLGAQARIRVRAVGNIFFDISNTNFSIQAPASPDFAFSNPEAVTACSGSSFTTTLHTAALSGFSSSIALSASGNPAGTTVVFSAASINPGASVMVSLQGSIPTGTHSIIVTGVAGSVTKTRTIVFNVISLSSLPALTAPANNATGQPAYPSFSWSVLNGATAYSLELSTNASFSPVAITVNGLGATSHTLASTLVSNTQYYWRVRATTICGTHLSAARAFTTAAFSCGNQSATDLPLAIASATPVTVTSTLNVAGSGTISDIDVIGLAGTHEYISDITVKLRSPSGTQVTLFDQVCDDQQNFSLSLDDAAATTVFPCPPVGGVTIRPQSPLSAFNGQNCNGAWNLVVEDNFSQDGGSLQSWGLKICISSGSLPVSWLHFTATRRDRSVLVEWSTASEIHNKHFEVQRSTDGIHFETLGLIMAGGASGVQYYLFNDLKPVSGDNYYRLKQVDNDGKFAYSAIAKVAMPTGKGRYSLYPNPARENTTLTFHTPMQKTMIRLADLTGKLVFSQALPAAGAGSTVDIPLGHLARGFYTVIIESATERFTEKLLVQ